MNKILTPKTDIDMYGGIQIVRASEVNTGGVCMSLYGKAGAGKTSLIAQVQDSEYGRDLWIGDVEAGVRSIRHRTDIYAPQFTSWEQIDRFTKKVQQDPSPPFKSFAWDNMTEILSMNLKKVTGGKTPTWQDYNPATAEMLMLARDWKDIARRKGINVFFLMWDHENLNESTGITRTELGFNKSLYQQFPGIVEIVCNLTVTNNPPFFTRVLDFQESPLTAAKMRRAKTEVAQSIPKKIPYGPDDSPMVDLLATLIGNLPFPADKYQMPKRKVNSES